MSATALAAWRLTAAAALLVPALWLRGRAAPPRRRPDRRERARLIAAGLCLAVHFVVWFASLERIPVARSTLLVCTSPLWAGLASWALGGRRPPALFWAGLALAAPGLWLVVRPAGAGPAAGAGDALAVAGAVAFAAYLLLAQGPQRRLGTARVVTWTYASAGLALWPAAAVAGGLLPARPGGWAAILALALVPQLLGHTALNWSLRHFAAGVVGAATLLEPVFAAALARWLFGEAVGPPQIAGAAVLLAGVLVVIRSATAP